MLPAANVTVSFSEHIKPLFRDKDQKAMHWAFDLGSYQDVKRHASAILERLQKGSMPCDGPWPQEQVEVFHRWVESGMAE